jgi:hypothetical protein
MDSIFLGDLDWPPILPASLTQEKDEVELIGNNLTQLLWKLVIYFIGDESIAERRVNVHFHDDLSITPANHKDYSIYF